MAVTIDGAGPLAGATTLNGLTIPTTGFGKILDVVSTTKTDTFSTTSTSLVAVTGLSAAITPKSTGSKILVTCSFFHGNNFNLSQITFDLQRDATSVFKGDAAGSNRRSATGTAFHFGTDNYGAYTSVSFLDSPATTSSTTYQLYFAADPGSSTTIYLNRTFNDTDLSYTVRGASSITLMEVQS